MQKTVFLASLVLVSCFGLLFLISSTPLNAGKAPKPRHHKLQKSHAKDPCALWRRGLQKRKLLLSNALRKKLIRQGMSQVRPQPKKAHRRLIRRYSRVRREVQEMRRCYLKEYKRLRTKKSRIQLLKRVETSLREVLERAILPLWIGTSWDYYGTAVRPHQKGLACGYFVTHALLGVGFRFPDTFIYRSKRKGAMRIYEFAKQAALGMMKQVSSPGLKFATSNKPTSRLLPHLRRRGPGLYILGLDDHVGLVHYNGHQAFFWHSGGTDTDAWVKREPLTTAVQVVASRYRVLGKIKLDLYRKWLYRTPIRVTKKRR